MRVVESRHVFSESPAKRGSSRGCRCLRICSRCAGGRADARIVISKMADSPLSTRDPGGACVLPRRAARTRRPAPNGADSIFLPPPLSADLVARKPREYLRLEFPQLSARLFFPSRLATGVSRFAWDTHCARRGEYRQGATCASGVTQFSGNWSVQGVP